MVTTVKWQYDFFFELHHGNMILLDILHSTLSLMFLLSGFHLSLKGMRPMILPPESLATYKSIS